MVQTRTRDHGASNTKSQVSSRKGAKTPVVKDKKPVAKDKASAPKRDHDAAEPEEAQSSRDDGNNAQAPGTKRAKHDHGSATTQAKGAEKRKAAAASDVDSKKVQDIISKYGGLPLSDIGLSKPTEATPETILAFVLSAMLTSARISHELAYKSVKCLIEAGYHDVHTLKKSSWVERTEALTKGGYTRYREKTATALGELADFVLDEYGRSLSHVIALSSVPSILYHDQQSSFDLL